MDEIRALVAFEGRAPGTDAERRAARHLERRLEELGRSAEIEPVDAWPRWAGAYALHATVAIAGSLVSVSAPLLGAALVAAGALLTFLDGAGLLVTTRRLLGRRASQNVVSRQDGGKPGTLVLTAHLDAGRTATAFARGIEERRAVLGNLLHRPIGPLEPVFWAMIALVLCTLLRLPGIEGTALTAVQFVPTVALILAVPLLIEAALGEVSPGANDNASGVATALRLADRHDGALEHFDVWVLLTGAQEALSGGMRSFLRRHRKALDRRSTVFLNLDEVGAGTVRYTRREGALVAVRSHVQLVEICQEIAEDDADEGAFGARSIANRRPSDGQAARSRGFPALTLTCRDALDLAPRHHEDTDTPERIDEASLERAFGFCSELIERLDAAIGPDLERSEELQQETA